MRSLLHKIKITSAFREFFANDFQHLGRWYSGGDIGFTRDAVCGESSALILEPDVRQMFSAAWAKRIAVLVKQNSTVHLLSGKFRPAKLVFMLPVLALQLFPLQLQALDFELTKCRAEAVADAEADQHTGGKPENWGGKVVAESGNDKIHDNLIDIIYVFCFGIGLGVGLTTGCYCNLYFIKRKQKRENLR